MVNTIIRKILILLFVAGTTGITKLEAASAKAPVDYVNPYMGNISHLLVPTDRTSAQQYVKSLSAAW